MELIRYMISDAAKKIDVEPHVLRYWEEELAVEIPRNEMGHRYYRDEEISTMKGVKYLKEKGFQLKSIKILLPNMKKVMVLEQRRLLELRDRLELAVSQEELRLQREEELRRCEETDKQEGLEDGRREGWENGRETGKREGLENGREAGRKESLDIGREQDKRASMANNEETGGKKDFKHDRDFSGGQKSEHRKTTDLNEKDSLQDGKEPAAPFEENEKKELSYHEAEEGAVAQGADKMRQFRTIMNGIIMDVMLENNRKLTNSITESVSREMEYQMKRKELQEEEHFKQLDRLLREYQQGLKQTAVAKEYSGTRKQSKFFKKHKVRI